MRNGKFFRREWPHAADAQAYAEKIRDHTVNSNVGYALEWALLPRGTAQQVEPGVSAEERAALMAAFAPVEPPAPEPATARWNWALGPNDDDAHRLDVQRLYVL